LAKWGLGVRLHGSNPEPLMSALGQKRTFTRLQPMSALPPKADMTEQDRDVRFVPITEVLSRSVSPLAQECIGAGVCAWQQTRGHPPLSSRLLRVSNICAEIRLLMVLWSTPNTFAASLVLMADVRFGSKADIARCRANESSIQTPNAVTFQIAKARSPTLRYAVAPMPNAL